MKSRLLRIKRELGSFTHQERLFVLFAMLCSFFITMEATVVKAVASSIFLSSYGVEFLPYVWVALIPLNLLLVNFNNRYTPLIGPLRMLLIFMGVSAILNIVCVFYLESIIFLPFVLYMWKDVYILLMYQQLWPTIHSTINSKRAKYLYGLIFGVGGLGSVLGSTIPGFFAVQYGSAHLLITTIPFYMGLGICFYFCIKMRSQIEHSEPISFTSKKSSFMKGARLIGKSRYLQYILLIVMMMQIVSTLLDFNFNSMLERFVPIKDERTEFLGRLFGGINTINLVIQFLGSFLFIKAFGFKRSHLLIPLYLLSIVGLSAAIPIFSLITVAYASAKCSDYSLFTVLKEMLYIPLNPDEKFHAKAIIDVFAYRTSKAVASFAILLLEIFALSHVTNYILLSVMGLCIVWAIAVTPMARRYQSLSA